MAMVARRTTAATASRPVTGICSTRSPLNQAVAGPSAPWTGPGTCDTARVERVDEHGDAVVVHVAQKAQGDVPLSGWHHSEARHRTQRQIREPPHRQGIGPHGHEHPHTKVCPTVSEHTF